MDAPSIKQQYQWRIATDVQAASGGAAESHQDVQNISIYNLPSWTIEAASHRISALYENIIFDDTESEDDIILPVGNLNEGHGEIAHAIFH